MQMHFALSTEENRCSSSAVFFTVSVDVYVYVCGELGFSSPEHRLTGCLFQTAYGSAGTSSRTPPASHGVQGLHYTRLLLSGFGC